MREGRDPLLNEAKSLPAWAAEELGIMREIVEYEEPQILMVPPQMDVDDSDEEYEGVVRETEDIEDLVVTFMERLVTMDRDD
jgi:hypothetical protein